MEPLKSVFAAWVPVGREPSRARAEEPRIEKGMRCIVGVIIGTMVDAEVDGRDWAM